MSTHTHDYNIISFRLQALEAEDIYDVVDADDRLNKRLRQDHDDFVEDDDGLGYADNGEDEHEVYSDEYPEESHGKGKLRYQLCYNAPA